ncbi:MAG: DoxX family protein [Actinomycetota bacterium]|nr:DoxX family protein [Actinomycetota bacterium]
MAETAGGVLLAVGLLTPLAAAAILAVMLNAAVVVHARNGVWVQQGGYEYPLVLGAVSAGIALTGPDAFALDAIAGWDLTGAWAAAGIIGGLAVGAAVLALRQQPQPAGQDRSERHDSGRPGTPAHAV